MGLAARRALPALIMMRRDTEGAVRESVAQALKRIVPKAEDTVPTLIALLGDREQQQHLLVREEPSHEAVNVSLETTCGNRFVVIC